MIGRVVEIAGDNRHLSLFRAFMLVTAPDDTGKKQEIGRVPLEGLAAVIANGYGLSFSANLLEELVSRQIAFILCGRNHQPAALLWPVDGHYQQTGRLRDQIGLKDGLRGRLWRDLVRSKIAQQAAALRNLGAAEAVALEQLATRVRPGDPDNLEAQAARRYWPALFGPDFRRDTEATGPNSLLNYAYAVLRAGMARAVMGAGLHPSLGLHHSGAGNAMVLVDDLLEPFRPFADLLVCRLVTAGRTEVTPAEKKTLASLLVQDLPTAGGMSPLSTCQLRLATSLATALAAGKGTLELPPQPPPLWAATLLETGKALVESRGDNAAEADEE